jgi:hypothetical protein
MLHLSNEQLLDLAEGAQSAASIAHVESCESCRREVEELRAVVVAAADVDVPEPSPLFWEHFSERVRDAVAAEGQPASPRAWKNWASGWRLAIPLAGAAALLVAVAITLGPDSPATDNGDRNAAVVVNGPEPAPVDIATVAEDPSLRVLADLTSDLDWDTANEAGLVLKAGAVDDLVAALNDDERQELRRLLQDELARTGA